MTHYRLEAEAAVELDIEAAFEWYQAEEPNLGFEFIEQLRTAYQRILEHPLAYQELRSGIRRNAVLHTARDPEEWQHRV